jgi:hypothetical protein
VVAGQFVRTSGAASTLPPNLSRLEDRAYVQVSPTTARRRGGPDGQCRRRVKPQISQWAVPAAGSTMR